MTSLDHSEALSSGLSSGRQTTKSQEEYSQQFDGTPRSTARRTTRTRPARQATAGMSDSDFSEDDDSPRKSRTAGRLAKKSGKQGTVLRDDSGRPLSPAEARRQRKRVTNRESARRMRLLRKEEWNNLQQEVHDKTIELQKVHQMNRHLNEGYAQLEARCRGLQHHNHALVNEVLSLVEHLRENLGKEIDNKRLAAFLRNMSQLLPQQPSGLSSQVHQSNPVNQSWMPHDFKAEAATVEGKFGHGQIHVTAHSGHGIPMDGMKRAASAPEPQPHFPVVGIKRQRLSDAGPPAEPLSPHHQHAAVPPLHPATPTAAAGVSPAAATERSLMPPPMAPPQPPSAAPDTDAAPQPAAGKPEGSLPHAIIPGFPGSLVPAPGGSLDIDFTALGRFPSVDPQFCAEISANGGLDPQLSIGKLLAFDIE